MGSRKKADFAPFSDWLESDLYFSPASAYTYASNVRKMYRLCEAITPDALDAFLEGQRYPAPYRAAWKKFGEWAKSKGIEVASPSPASSLGSGRQRLDCSIPGSICDDILEIAKSSHIPMSKIAGITWGNVVKHVRNGAWEVSDPSEPGSYYRVPIRPMERVEAWGFPEGPSPSDAFIPVIPGGAEPMPYRILTRILATHKRSQTQH